MNAKQSFDQQDREMFCMVNEKTAARRKRREELELACIEQAELPTERRSVTLQAMGGAVIRAGMGGVILGGITRGLVDPAFGIAMTAVCCIWAVGYWQRNRYGYR